MKKRTKILLIIAVLLALIISVPVYYATVYYRAENVDSYLADNESVTVTTIDEGWLFDGKGEDKALFFYPGAQVEETAYAPLLHRLAENGIDCFLLKTPLKLAFFATEAPTALMEAYTYEHYYLAGHSLGGLVAADYAGKHPDNIEGLFMLAGYPDVSLTECEFPVLFIYGDRDGILRRYKITESAKLVNPAYSETIVIDGGNHSGFGSYGLQKNDVKAAIEPEEQWQQTTDIIVQEIETSQN